MGNSMGRAPWGRSEMEATRGWPGGKPWEIVWGELQGEGAIRKRRQGNHLQWEEAGVITVTNASFSNEKNFQSQQGRIHFLGHPTEIKDDKNTAYRVLPLSFGSTTIKRVCRSTLQAETYALQNGLETGNTLRGVIAELKGQICSLKSWEEDARSCIPHLAMTDCRSLSDHLNQEVLAKVSDKCLGIELQGIHENLWIDGRRSWSKCPNGGDKLIWIATSTMVSDCLTKSMRPDLLLRVLKECHYVVQTFSFSVYVFGLRKTQVIV